MVFCHCPNILITGIFQVRVEAALTLRALAEVDPTCVGGLISYGVTTLSALRENLSFEKVLSENRKPGNHVRQYLIYWTLLTGLINSSWIRGGLSLSV